MRWQSTPYDADPSFPLPHSLFLSPPSHRGTGRTREVDNKHLLAETLMSGRLFAAVVGGGGGWSSDDMVRCRLPLGHFWVSVRHFTFYTRDSPLVLARSPGIIVASSARPCPCLPGVGRREGGFVGFSFLWASSEISLMMRFLWDRVSLREGSGASRIPFFFVVDWTRTRELLLQYIYFTLFHGH